MVPVRWSSRGQGLFGRSNGEVVVKLQFKSVVISCGLDLVLITFSLEGVVGEESWFVRVKCSRIMLVSTCGGFIVVSIVYILNCRHLVYYVAKIVWLYVSVGFVFVVVGVMVTVGFTLIFTHSTGWLHLSSYAFWFGWLVSYLLLFKLFIVVSCNSVSRRSF